MLPRRALPLLALAAVLVAPVAARADTLVTPAPGAKNLAAAGGYLVWAAPDGARWRLTVRTPDGRVTTPPIAAFATPPRASIGSDRFGIQGRRLLAVYARDGDIFQIDLRRGGSEERVPQVSSRAYRESAPSMANGHYVFVRRGGKRPGLYHLSLRRTGPQRVAKATPRETATNGSRFAYAAGGNVVVRRISSSRGSFFFEAPTVRSLIMTRYRAAWLTGDRPFSTTRFAGSGGPYDPTVEEGTRALPGVDSLAYRGGSVGYYLDAEGVKSVQGALF